MKLPLKTVVVYALAGLSGTLLLYTSQAVQNTQRELNMTRAKMEQEQSAVDMLRAEWAFLSAPARLQKIVDDDGDIKMGQQDVILPTLKMLQGDRSVTQEASFDGGAP